MASFIDLVKRNIENGLATMQPVQLSTEFSAIKEIRAATSITTPQVINRLNETNLMWTTYGFDNVSGGSYTGQKPSNGLQMKLEFMTDSRLFEIKTIGSLSSYSIFVDGKLVTLDAITTPTTEGVSWIQVKANDGVVSGKLRHIEIYGVNTAFGSFAFGPLDTISRDITIKRPFIYQMGDSYTAGTGAGFRTQSYGSSPAVNDFYTFSRALGFDGICEGIGGSAWTSKEEGRFPINRVKTRLAALNRKPDVISWALGYNDSVSINDPGKAEWLLRSMSECLEETRKTYSDVPIIQISCATPIGLNATTQRVVELVDGFCADNGIPVINISNYVTAANSEIYTGTDRVHPGALGHEFRGMAMAREVFLAATGQKSLMVPVKPRGFNVVARLTKGFGVRIFSGVVNAIDENDVAGQLYLQTGAQVEILSVSRV
ncbi:hypothetical protein Sf12_gp58 [Shigella phage Sf12]|uniref:SGNH hydrolase-type esterase domain-containing protein n=1 Tax=Shigella phage Sf12 TaxID=2024315 RepID=A0A291AXQ0_9CAUD|nr:head decoration [Shigella phage Sf12]ATE85784.1 hypothetical protein Sf12_gp58 [Shigella phage Sf12]